jgi:hypothetical protein
VKKQKLKVDYSDIQENIKLYSIASTESDIRICYILNQILGINLSLAEDMMIQNKNTVLSFRNYYYESEDGSEKYYLILNKADSNFLFSELKKVDYIFVTMAESEISDINTSIQNIKNQPEILALIPIDPGKIKSFNKIKF